MFDGGVGVGAGEEKPEPHVEQATTAAIRGMPCYNKLPIIMVTAKAMAGDREKSLASGASDYVTKPVAEDELVRCIGRWLLN